MPHRELASRLGRSIRSIESRLGKLRLRRFTTRPFTQEEDDAIRVGFGGSSGELGRRFDRDPSVIRARAKRLGLGFWKRELREYRGYKIARIDRDDGSTCRRVPEHRVVMEKHFGRCLTDAERVHHINFNKRDNRVENLYVCSNNSAHMFAHHSVNAIIAELLERGGVVFDHTQGIYRLCETGK